MRSLALVLALAAGCGARATPTAPERSADCEACLASGGTWQLSSCTRDCALADAACFVDRCPGPCGAAGCGDCFSREACERAGCSWQIAGEAMWCR
ncbi:MAG: hypothetical protein U0234_31055 [Sandaracinus sp.]